MQNILIFYGGKSVEHDISILTAIQTIKNINKEKYNVIPVYQTKSSQFIIVKDYLNPKTYITNIKRYKKVDFKFGLKSVCITGIFKHIYKIDCAINCCHGINGEDGTISALMNLCDIPYTSSNILGSSICMDKIIMKDIFKANKIPCVDYTYITNNEFILNKDKCIENIIKKLSFPLIVKPSNLGSSIGISKATTKDELLDAINIAFYYDKRILIEKCLTNFKEINIACLGNENCELSSIEQPINWEDFLNFDDKYSNIKNKKTKILNPNLEKDTLNQIHKLSKKMFKIFDLSGVVRIDYMIDENNKVFVNEINTVPGSLSFYLWKDKNIEFFELIDRLISLAKEKYNSNKMYKYNFTSSVLTNYKENNINKYSK